MALLLAFGAIGVAVGLAIRVLRHPSFINSQLIRWSASACGFGIVYFMSGVIHRIDSNSIGGAEVLLSIAIMVTLIAAIGFSGIGPK